MHSVQHCKRAYVSEEVRVQMVAHNRTTFATIGKQRTTLKTLVTTLHIIYRNMFFKLQTLKFEPQNGLAKMDGLTTPNMFGFTHINAGNFQMCVLHC